MSTYLLWFVSLFTVVRTQQGQLHYVDTYWHCMYIHYLVVAVLENVATQRFIIWLAQVACWNSDTIQIVLYQLQSKVAHVSLKTVAWLSK